EISCRTVAGIPFQRSAILRLKLTDALPLLICLFDIPVDASHELLSPILDRSLRWLVGSAHCTSNYDDQSCSVNQI
ncbi:MAG: hypothetical protein WBW78_18935, partial [Terrimicrobiaceae bacterium]